MNGLQRTNPIPVFALLGSLGLIIMFCSDTVLLAVSLPGALCLRALLDGRRGLREAALLCILPLITALLNPLFNHNGVTVLLILNDRPITLEAVFYGLSMGVMILAVLLWSRSFSQLMTTDKLLYLFGSASPKLSLILSMTLRYIPLFRRQTQKTDRAQQAMGLYKDDTLADRLRGALRVFSVMVTWALENGAVTADSMTARGYGVGHRTQFALLRFRRSDGLLLGAVVLLCGITVWAAAAGRIGTVWYPVYSQPQPGMLGTAAYLAYGLLAFIPAILEGGEALRWKSLLSEI